MASAKAQAVSVPDREPTEADANRALNDMVLLAMPTVLFKQLSEAALKRNMTLPQLLSTAITDYLKRTE